MFNDVLNVRDGNEKRKKALAAVAQKLAMNGQRAAGLVGAARAGGGLGQQQAARFRPLARNNMGALARLALGGRADLGNAIGRFGITERQPGAFDPGAIPGIGGIDATGSLGNGGQGVPVGGQSGPAPSYAPNTSPDTQQSAAGGDPEAFAAMTGQSDVDPFPSSFQSGPSGGDYSGYVNWQGQLIPVGLFKALQASGELY